MTAGAGTSRIQLRLLRPRQPAEIALEPALVPHDLAEGCPPRLAYRCDIDIAEARGCQLVRRTVVVVFEATIAAVVAPAGARAGKEAVSTLDFGAQTGSYVEKTGRQTASIVGISDTNGSRPFSRIIGLNIVPGAERWRGEARGEDRIMACLTLSA